MGELRIKVQAVASPKTGGVNNDENGLSRGFSELDRRCSRRFSLSPAFSFYICQLDLWIIDII